MLGPLVNDRPELALDRRRRRLDRRGIGDVDRRRQRPAARRLDLPGAPASSSPPREQPEACPAPRERSRRRAPDTGRGAGDDDDLRLARSTHPAATSSPTSTRRARPGRA
jgi:hypothetical protein